jgi:PAS domain S-box-containing protein
MIRVLVAEDEQALRDAICDLVASEADMEIVGSVASAEQAIALAATTVPDVAILDVRMPGGGPEGARGITARLPETRVLALSAYEEQTSVLEMLRAGAVGYLVKGIAPSEIVEAIRRAVRGQASLSIDVITAELGALASEIGDLRQAEEVRGRSDERFGALLQSAPDAVIIADDAGRIVLVNDRTEALFGYAREELDGRPTEMLLPERFRERHVAHRTDYLGDPRIRPMGVGLELAGRRKDGTEFPVDISLSAIDTDEGRLLTAFVRDISERRTGEIAIRQLAAIVESSDDAIISKSLDGTILTWNRGAEHIFGYTAPEVIGRSINLIIPIDQPDELPECLKQLKRGEEIEQYETIRLRKDGAQIAVSLKISGIRDAGGALVGTSTIAHDITQQRAQGDLVREHAERRALLAHLVAAGEEERARIAGNIHDDSIQSIIAAGMRLQILRRDLRDPEQLRLLADLEETIQLSIVRLRNLLFELRPPALDNEGLSAALEMYLHEAEGQSDTQYRLEDKLTSQPPPETRTILDRIVQEALVNVRKHARAKRATVSLSEREGGYLVRVVDDGIGFAAGEATAAPGHLGLVSMRERAALAGGWLSVEAMSGQGTTVEVWIPALPDEDEPAATDPAGREAA